MSTVEPCGCVIDPSHGHCAPATVADLRAELAAIDSYVRNTPGKQLNPLLILQHTEPLVRRWPGPREILEMLAADPAQEGTDR